MKPTPEQVRELVAWAGGQQKAGEAVGVGRSTIRYWLAPDLAMQQQKKWRQAQQEAGVCCRCGRHPSLSGWYCALCLERNAAEQRERYHNETGIQRNARLLRLRRHKALRRMKQRNARKDATNGTLSE
jgi:hypothetical protein